MKPLFDLLQRTPEEGAALVARGWLADARAAAVRLEDRSDTEALHDFRVAIRRLRSTARQWRRELAKALPPKRRRALRGLQRSTGTGRDAEVALLWLAEQRESLAADERPGLEHLSALFEARHAAAMAEARLSVRRRFAKLDARLSKELETVRIAVNPGPPSVARRFGSALALRNRKSLQRLEKKLDAVGSWEAHAETHAARIAGKRLRYLIEPLRREASESIALCKELQDVLGDLNDAHFLGAKIRRTERDAPEPARPGLHALGQRCDARARRLFDAFEKDWLDGKRVRLAEAVEAFAQRCEDTACPPVEIERKYLLERLPDLAALRSRGVVVESLEIDQGWLPGERLRERIRRTRRPDGETRFVRTVKLGAGISRVEVEEAASQSVFEALWPLTEGCRVRKRRHLVQEGPLLWEIDEFLDRDLALAEVELADPEIRPALPAWLGVAREVTDEASYTNLELAR